jgi:TRAP-type transport system periplasmic protein
MVYFNAQRLVDFSGSLYEKSSGYKQEFDAVGIKKIYTRHLPNYRLLCKKPIRNLEAFRGVKLRTYGSYVPILFESLGAIPVTVNASEQYAALEKGDIDCAYLPPALHMDWKLHEIAKYMIDIPFGMIEFGPVVVSQKKWNSWPPETQRLIMEVAKDTEKWAFAKTEMYADLAVAKMIVSGVQIIDFKGKTEMRKRLPDMWSIWLARQKAAGKSVAAEEILVFAKKANLSN